MTDAEKIRRLPWGVAGDALSTVSGYLTVFGTPFILMLGMLGLPNTQIGLILSLFTLFGVTSLVTAPSVAHWGFKRTFLTFWTLRYLVLLFLLLLPLVDGRWHEPGAFRLVVVVLGAFALCKAIGETASYPWSQETVPHSVRAKFTAIDTIICSVVAAASIAVAGWVIGAQRGLHPFMVLMAVGIAFGVAGNWATAHLPGGAPLRNVPEMTSRTGMKEALRDHNFLLYLGAIATFNLAGGPGAFLPLYLQHQVGLAKAVIVWLQLAGLAGAVATSYFWGWVTDRYGGKPAMLTALPASVVIPVFWFMIPRQSPWSTPVAALLFGLGSALGMGWVLGTNRLLFVKIVPPERKTQYMAVNYAWMGIIGVAAPLLPGWALDHFQGIRGSLGPFPVDQYSLLWAGNSVLAALTFLWVIRLRTSGELGMREFTGLFVHGNPLLAAEALVRYSFATEERTRLSTTEMMGRAKSPLHVEELVEGLHDPSFNVRHEAIVALAHMQPDERATAGLVEVLQGRQPDLAVAAAWALGRIGDRRALEPLRQALEGDFPMVQAASARALGTLRDEQAAPLLLERLPTLPVPLRTAYAAALGAMRYRPAVSAILELLREPSDSSEELTLALARIMGAERHFIHLWRSMRTAPAAGAAAEARGWRAKLKRRRVRDPAVEELVARSERAFAVEQMAEGTEAVNALLEYLAAAALPDPLTEIMSTCRRHLLARDREYRDCLLLALHAIGLALNYLQPEGATEEAPPALPPTPRLGIDKRHN